MYVQPPAPPAPPVPPSSVQVGTCVFAVPPLPFNLPLPSLTIPSLDLSFLFVIDMFCPLDDTEYVP